MTLEPRQQGLIDRWLPGAEFVKDMSWGLVDSTVLHLSSRGRDVVVKAGGPANHHIGREITAYTTAVPVLGDAAPTLIHSDRAARILVTSFIDGELVDDGPWESDPATIREAGRILSVLHGLDTQVDETIERNLVRAALRWLSKENGIPRAQAAEARRRLEEYVPSAAAVVPSHGDYSGRNWIRSDSLGVIDFGRFGYRPARQDFLRMFFRRGYDHPEERELFSEGYGQDISGEGRAWWTDVLREAVATVGWAHKVGDRSFEDLGRRFIEIALDELTGL